MATTVNWHTLSNRLVEPARWVLIALIAYTLAMAVLYFLSPPPGANPAPAAAGQTVTRSGVAAAAPEADVEAIIARNLFGASDGSVGSAVVEAPVAETRLPLELHGVFVADLAADSAAIVAQKGKPGQLYTVGATLPGNAELVEVHADHIVLRRAGTRETLTFPDTPTQFVVYDEVDDASDWLENLGYDDAEALNGAFAPTDFSPADGDDPASARDFVTSYRELIDEDPQGALSELGIEPVSEGASAGYRLGDLADSPYLSQTGLQPGDVILSVNGRPVGDIRQDKMELDNVLAQGSARLEVQRGTRRFFVTASLQ